MMRPSSFPSLREQLHPLVSAHFEPLSNIRQGGGYELSNPKGNVPRRQLPGEK